MKPGLYNIPAGRPFARDLAQGLLDHAGGRPEALSVIRLLLPSRRVCRIVQDSFLSLAEGRPLILPRLVTLGDVEEEELNLSAAALSNPVFLNIPPAISPLRRQFILARLIMKMSDTDGGFARALPLAKDLGRFMDQVYTEGLDMAQLAALVPEEFSAHWQITLDFLHILTAEWPKILAEQGCIDAADRRVRLMHAQAEVWSASPPQTPVIAAGTTGSIPATAALLNVIAQLPQGVVVLPGLDTALDDESWQALAEDHPQYGLKILLERLEMDRLQVRPWPASQAEASPAQNGRCFLVREMMRPAATTGAWTDFAVSRDKRQTIRDGLSGLSLVTAADEQEEATVAAIMIRETLETPGRRVAVVTPDRSLARRISALCKKWGVETDDSAGMGLDRTPLGVFLLLVLDVAISDVSPLSVLALLKHSLCGFAQSSQRVKDGILHLEIEALRGPKPFAGFEGIANRIRNEVTNTDRADTELILEQFAAIYAPLIDGSKQNESFKISELIEAHLRVTESLLSRNDTDSPENEADSILGDVVAGFFADLKAQSAYCPELSWQGYRDLLRALMAGITVRPAYGTHPRVSILGQIESRFIDADVLILCGLSEGVWPEEDLYDPWMSRGMRKTFGLPGLQRSIGLSAHDFMQLTNAGKVILTTANKRGGMVALPSRWLQRLKTVLQAAQIDERVLDHPFAALWVRGLLFPASGNDDVIKTGISRPAPKPPVSARPRRMAVTQVEKWLQDPYGLYARYVLALRPLDPIEQSFDAKLRGDVLHKTMHRFMSNYQKILPADSVRQFEEMLRGQLAAFAFDKAEWRPWWVRLQRVMEAFLAHEACWRESGAKIMALETKGILEVAAPAGPVVFSAVADRIDHLDGQAVVIDYKSGSGFSGSGIANGKHPQLALEALIVDAGGFEGIPALEVQRAAYWPLALKDGDFKPIELKKDMQGVLVETRRRLKELLAAYDDQATAYHCQPRPGFAPRFNDYEHLSRIREWGVAGDSEDEAAEEAA